VNGKGKGQHRTTRDISGHRTNFSRKTASVHEFSVALPFSVREHRAPFSKTGYPHFEIFEEPDKGWLCAIANKPDNRT
jgi:hypothetical protein